jgi:hypothetical protein
MGRKKVRNYLSVKEVEDMINNYFYNKKDEVIKYICENNGSGIFNSLNELHEFDVHGSYFGGFGLDCGWCWISPKRSEQHREWVLDNGKWDAYARDFILPYNTQSTTLKKLELEKALKDLNIEKYYSVYVRLD